jgi:hypothetical protein
LTGILRDIVLDALGGEGDIVLVAEVDSGGAASGVRAHDPNTVVWACRDAVTADALGDLLYGHPHLRVLTVEREGRGGHVHELVPKSTSLGELSTQRLLAAVRGTEGG